MLFLRCPKCGQRVPYKSGEGAETLHCPECGTFLGDVTPERGEVSPEGKPIPEKEIPKEEKPTPFKRCPKCGAKILKDWSGLWPVVCLKCGADLEVPKEGAPQEKLEAKKTKDYWLPGCLIFMAIFLIIAVVIGLQQSEKTPQQPSKPPTLQQKVQQAVSHLAEEQDWAKPKYTITVTNSTAELRLHKTHSTAFLGLFHSAEEYRFQKVLQTVFSQCPKINRVKYIYYTTEERTDVYGQQYPVDVLVCNITISRESFNKINWDRFKFRNLYIVAEECYLNPKIW